MANHYYIISEVQFYNDKNDKQTWDFISGTGIDLNQSCLSKMPNIADIKNALIDFGLITEEIFNKDERIEISAKNDKNGIWLIFTGAKDYFHPINIFEVERGSNHDLVIDFIKFLGNTHGKFLFYCDAGIMLLITRDKDKALIKKEMMDEKNYTSEDQLFS